MQNPNQNTNAPDAQLMTLRILTLAMGMSVCLFGFVLFATQKWNLNQIQFQELLNSMQMQIMFGMGVLILVLRTPIANNILKATIQDVDINNKTELLKISLPSHVIRLAFAEASALFGFAISFLYNESTSFLILGLAALIAIAREWPSHESFKRKAELLQSLRRTSRT